MISADLVVGLFVLAGGGLFYVLPSVLAARRQRPDLPQILLRNVYLGWTGLGWLWCLHRALQASPAVLAAETRADLQCEALPDWVSGLRREDRAWRGLPVRTVELWDVGPR